MGSGRGLQQTSWLRVNHATRPATIPANPSGASADPLATQQTPSLIEFDRPSLPGGFFGASLKVTPRAETQTSKDPNFSTGANMPLEQPKHAQNAPIFARSEPFTA